MIQLARCRLRSWERFQEYQEGTLFWETCYFTPDISICKKHFSCRISLHLFTIFITCLTWLMTDVFIVQTRLAGNFLWYFVEKEEKMGDAHLLFQKKWDLDFGFWVKMGFGSLRELGLWEDWDWEAVWAVSSRRHQLGHIGPSRNTSEHIGLGRNTSRHIGEQQARTLEAAW